MVVVTNNKSSDKWIKVSKKVNIGGVEVVKIDIDVVDDVIEFRNKEYIDSIAKSRGDAKAGKLYTLEEVYK